ncbi:helix-turn-helix domain-containing protein [Pannonibacter phragmitetus]|uniref:helix-turn-helix domain-containing protein n=1 Tax=Pannonibacter phragmitetus TaxID=121719 RepID=UPI003D2EFD03
MTLQQLADQAGISVGFLSQVERGKATPSLGTLAAIADALGVEIDWFVATPKPANSITRSGERELFSLGEGPCPTSGSTRRYRAAPCRQSSSTSRLAMPRSRPPTRVRS